MDVKIEYRVRPVTRYIVTRYEEGANRHGAEERGEFSNFDMAYAVGYALAAQERERLGYPLGDERIRYPDPEPDAKLDRARFYRKMADELQAMDAQERYRREHPEALKQRAIKPRIGPGAILPAARCADIRPPPQNPDRPGDTVTLQTDEGLVTAQLREDGDFEVLMVLGVDPGAIEHASDCAVHNAPAMEPGPCDCGAEERP